MVAQFSFTGGSMTEPTFNSALAEALGRRRNRWRDDAVVSERTDVLLGHPALRPDILLQPKGGNPVSVEVEIDSDPEPDARERIGHKTKSSGRTILAAVALRVPAEVRSWPDSAYAREALEGSRRGASDAFVFDYAVISEGASKALERWPREGFCQGTVDDLAEVCESVATPAHVISDFASLVAEQISAQAEGLRGEISDETARAIAHAIGQRNVAQGLRLACCVWMTTLRLHDLLAEQQELRDLGLRSIAEMRSDDLSRGSLHLQDVRDAWRIVNGYNYRSIFEPASGALVDSLPSGAGSDVLDNLADLAVRVNSERLGDHVDFTGQLFPRLLQDRSETAAFYTLPDTAAMLARLGVDRMKVSDWSSLSEVSQTRIADFACGTGTLLRAAYQRIRTNFESSGGGEVAELHRRMMEESVTGTDINGLAAHMTAAALSTIEIGQKYLKTNVGSVAVQGGKTGSLEFIEHQQLTNVMGYAETSGADKDDWTQIHATDGEYSLVIQNPPYTRPRGGRKIFDVAGVSEPERARSQKRLTQLRNGLKRSGNTVPNGQAGLGSDFSALADRKLGGGGVFASVLPLTAAHAESWSGFREHLAKSFTNITAITFATDSKSSMSADTDENEMLLVGDKLEHKRKVGMVLCVNLDRWPASISDATEIARQIQIAEDSEVSHGQLRVGDERVGEWLRQPIAGSGFPWYGLGMRSRYLGEFLGRLYQSKFNASWDRLSLSFPLRMVSLGDVFKIGPTHDLMGHIRGKDPRGAFAFDAIAGGDVPVYPALWAADANKQRRLIAEHTHDGDPVRGREDLQERMICSKGNLFVSRTFRMTSQALAAAWTSQPMLSGRAWVSISGSESHSDKASAIWFNSTLGMLTRYGYSQNTHSGRATLGVKAIAGLPVPDFSVDTPAGEHACNVTNREFNRLSELDLRPASYAFNDANRHEIDNVVLEMLGIDSPSTRAAIDRVRRLWCREPLVHGGNRKIMKDLGIEG